MGQLRESKKHLVLGLFVRLLLLFGFDSNVTVLVSPVGEHDLFGRNDFWELKSVVYQRPFATKYRAVFHPQPFEWLPCDIAWMPVE